AQLSRAHRGVPARRVPPKTPASVREIPLVAQLAVVLREHRRTSAFTAGGDWVFGTSRGTPLGHRNVERRTLYRAASIAEQRRVAAASLPRPPSYLRKPLDRRSRPRCRTGGPAP